MHKRKYWESSNSQHLKNGDKKEDPMHFDWNSVLPSSAGAKVNQELAAFQCKFVETAAEAMEAGDLPNYAQIWDNEPTGKTDKYAFKGGGYVYPLSTSFPEDQDVQKTQ